MSFTRLKLESVCRDRFLCRIWYLCAEIYVFVSRLIFVSKLIFMCRNLCFWVENDILCQNLAFYLKLTFLRQNFLPKFFWVDFLFGMHVFKKIWFGAEDCNRCYLYYIKAFVRNSNILWNVFRIWFLERITVFIAKNLKQRKT